MNSVPGQKLDNPNFFKALGIEFMMTSFHTIAMVAADRDY
jgi:hypothetical protein